MNAATKFLYESSAGKIEFAYHSLFWITEITGVSGVDISISESRSTRQIGTTVSGKSIQPRIVAIDGCIFEPLDTAREQLISAVSPAYPGTLTIQAGTESWYLDVIPQKTPEIMPGEGVQFFQLELYAAYPYWRTTEYARTQVSGLNALFQFPFFTGGEWWISQFNENLFTTIENDGNVPMEVKITFTARAALSNPELLHVGTGKKIRLRKDMAAGDRFLVSTVDGQRGVTFTAKGGDAENGFRYLSIDSDLSLELLPGDNLLRANADKGYPGLSVVVEAPKGVKSGV